MIRPSAAGWPARRGETYDSPRWNVRLTVQAGSTTTGTGWVESVSSIDWQRDELLAIGSSATGPIARVFLGSRAGKLIRASPVPVVVLPA